MTTVSYGQLDGLYEFDGGGDGTSWDDASNWEQVLDPFGAAISGNPATPPDAVTSADIPLTGVVVDSAGQTALNVSVGTAAGAGSLAVSSGDLTFADLRIGNDATNANPGSVDVSGGLLESLDDIDITAASVGSMTVGGGMVITDDDLRMGAGSSLVMTSGSIDVGDNFTTSDDASIQIDGGSLIVRDDLRWNGDVQATVNGGEVIVADKLRFDGDVTKNGKLTINGGLVRTEDFNLDIVDILTDFRGEVEINGDGVYQVSQDNDPSDGITLANLSVGTARALIAQGVHFTTSEVAPKQLGAFTVIVPDFFGETNLSFTQISVVPEPASVVLLGLGALGLVMRRRRS